MARPAVIIVGLPNVDVLVGIIIVGVAQIVGVAVIDANADATAAVIVGIAAAVIGAVRARILRVGTAA